MLFLHILSCVLVIVNSGIAIIDLPKEWVCDNVVTVMF